MLFSAALCRGLIEAASRVSNMTMGGGFPRLYAAASLKQAQCQRRAGQRVRFSAALCRGLIEASTFPEHWAHSTQFSAALCRGLIEARYGAFRDAGLAGRFPRLYAAASLKRRNASPTSATRGQNAHNPLISGSRKPKVGTTRPRAEGEDNGDSDADSRRGLGR